MLAYKFRLYPKKEEKVRSERPELKLVNSRPLLLENEKQVDWMKQEAPPARAG